MRKFVPSDLEEWGKIQRIGGDIMHARNLVNFDPDRDRDASFVRVSRRPLKLSGTHSCFLT
jgi:hypothetical protein